jgi:hypothetical protein
MKAKTMKNWTKGLMFALALGVSGVPSVASAQTGSDAVGDLAVATTLLPFQVSLAVMEAAISATMVGLVVGVVSSAAIGLTAVGVAEHERQREFERYLQENESAVQESLSMGSGEIVDELAYGLGLDEVEHAALGRLMRRERAVLSELADTDRLTTERAVQFIEHLARAMQADETLAPALERVAQGG